MASSIAKIPERDDMWGQLRSLQSFTDSMGALHDSQVYQLKMWGALAFQHTRKNEREIGVDVDRRVVTYKLSTKRKDPPNYPALVAGLDRSIHDMLGEDWKLVVEQRGTVIYDGPRLIEHSEKIQKQRKARAERER